MSSLKLSDGSAVALKPHYTHKAEREYNAIITEGVTFVTEIVRGADGQPLIDELTGAVKEKTVPQGMKATNATKANEALLRCLIDTITDKDGRLVPFSLEWLDNLPHADYQTLERAVLDMKAAVDNLKPAKDDDETGRESVSKK